jgi:serine phosphatase RsbU (regulator of sigma subunit)
MRRILFTNLFIVTAALHLNAFAVETDSLRSLLRRVNNDTQRIHLLVTIGEEEAIFRIGYWDSIRKQCEQGLLKKEAGTKKFYENTLALAINNVGYVADEQGDMKLALESYMKSAELCAGMKNQIGLGKALNNIGSVYEDMGDVVNALDYYHRSLKVREKIKDQKGVAVCYNNIGLIYFKQEDYKQALKYYLSALDILISLDHQQLIAISYNNIGLVYKKENKPEQALEYFTKGRAIQKSMGDDFNFLQTNSNVGLILESQGKYKEALVCYRENLKLAETLAFKKGIATSLSNIANILLLTGRSNEAQPLAEKSMRLFSELGFPEFISSSSNLLSRIYERNGNYKGAFDMHVLHKKMNDSINRVENKKAAIQKELQYTYDKKAAADSLRNVMQVKEVQLKIREEKMQRYYSYLGLAGLLVFSVVIFNRLKLSRRQNKVIQEQKKQVEATNEEISRQKKLVDEKQKEIIDSINYAKRIQQAVLTGESVWSGVSPEYFILFKPKDIVSGDFYWANNTAEGLSVFALADCTGHGVPGGFMSMLGNSFLNEIVVENKIFRANEILDRLRAKIIAALEQKGATQQKDGMDISLCVLNKSDNTLEFAGANNPIWLISSSTSETGAGKRELIEYKADKMPIGSYLDNQLPFSSTKLSLKRGDVIYLCSDGYADQFGGPDGKKLKYKKLKEILLENTDLAMDEQRTILDNFFEEWKGNYEQVDDVCVIGVRI